MNNNELQVVIGGYLAVNINDVRTTDEQIGTFITDMILKNNMVPSDVINVLNMFLPRSYSEDRVIKVLEVIGLKAPGIKRDLFQTLVHYYSIKENYTKMKQTIDAYKAQYGEDEHSIIAEMKMLFDSDRDNVPMDQMATLVLKIKKYI